MSALRELGSGWKLADFAPQDGLAAGAHTPAFVDRDWLPVSVPGDVHRALMAAGRIPDPFYDQNETACAWMEEREWWYRGHFRAPESRAPGERARLVFHGLDTFATVWLNGAELGRHRNMFRPAVFDVTGQLEDDNLLAVRFDPPLRATEGLPNSSWGRNPQRAAMRKAQFGYGWDWGPRLPTIGIWRPVELRTSRDAVIEGVHCSTVHLARDHSRASLGVRIELEQPIRRGLAGLTATVRLTPPDGGPSVERRIDLLDPDMTVYLEIARPRLWWTHALSDGEPSLYDLSVSVQRDEAEVDRYAARVGIRTIALDQAPDPTERGTRFFRFVLNGLPIFAMGANWIPCDSFVGAIPAERYASLLEDARAANMTMLRVWGGGIYEHDVFYDLCDRLGMLVWQDFMFACAQYPEAPEFRTEVEAEARYQVRRLRNHPSLALWCGNNENQWSHERVNWQCPEAELPPYGAAYYDDVLPKVVSQLDGQTPYWPGSPYGGDDHNSPNDGDVHNWEVWHGNFRRHFGEPPRTDPSPENVSYVRYAEDLGRFVSEFGLHASPQLGSLRRVIPETELFHHSPAMDWHTKDEPKNKGDNLMLGITGLPSTLEDYVDFSQLAQAEGLKFGIEHFRRRKPHCSGALVWQLNDCWPGTSWSVIDYYGVAKAAYYYLRRVFAPVLASFKPLADGSIELWVTNDSRDAFEDMLQVCLRTFDGQSIAEEQRAVHVHAGNSEPVWRSSGGAPGPERYLVVRSAAGRIPPNRHFFVPIKDLRRPAATPDVTVSGSECELHVVFRAPATAYILFAHASVADPSARFDDNYFDLEPGEQRTITISRPGGLLTPGDVTVGSR